MIEVLEWDAIGRAATLNCMVAGGEFIGFALVFGAFWPLIQSLKQESKDLHETLRIIGGKGV